MTKKKTYPVIAFIALCGMLWSACKQERSPCLTPTNVYLIAESIHKASDTATIFVDTGLSYAHFTALSPAGGITYTYQLSSSFNMTLSPNADSCRWIFANDTLQAVTDTISFYYSHSLKFLSNACGFTYFYTLNSVTTTHNLIDSVRITNKSVTNDVNNSIQHLQLYIHPAY